MRALIAVVVMGAAVGLVGCGKSGTRTYGTGSGSVTVSNSGDHMTATGSNGEKVEMSSGPGVTAKLPAFLPLYPGATVQTSVTGAGKDGDGGMVVFHTSAGAAAIVAFYKQKAVAAGMADTMNMQQGATTMYVATNEKTKQSVEVAATSAADGSTVQLTWSNGK